MVPRYGNMLRHGNIEADNSVIHKYWHFRNSFWSGFPAEYFILKILMDLWVSENDSTFWVYKASPDLNYIVRRLISLVWIQAYSFVKAWRKRGILIHKILCLSLEEGLSGQLVLIAQHPTSGNCQGKLCQHLAVSSTSHILECGLGICLPKCFCHKVKIALAAR